MWPVEMGTESQLNHGDYLQGRGSSRIRAEVQFLEAGMDVLESDDLTHQSCRGKTRISAWKFLVATLLLLERDLSMQCRNERDQLWR